MIEKDIVFVTTTLYTKWLDYQSKIISKLFPDSQHIIIDGKLNWPNSWFCWIDEIKKSDKKYYIHIDEDFFITDKSELLNAITKVESGKCDIIGCPDGYHHYRGANPIAINSFLMIGKVDDVKRCKYDFNNIKFGMTSHDNGKTYSWTNNFNLIFSDRYKDDFDYKYQINGGSNFINNQEPYYAFLWAMKEIGCKFDYLYPHFNSVFKSTNPRLDESSNDIGIHMWYTRQWNTTMDVHGLPNNERYNLVEKHIRSIYEI